MLRGSRRVKIVHDTACLKLCTNFDREKEYRKTDINVKNEKAIFHENNQKSKIKNPKSHHHGRADVSRHRKTQSRMSFSPSED
jgi:phosphoribosylformylglycinamidine (FGAM) synthase-like amidotransferase family enzyme